MARVNIEIPDFLLSDNLWTLPEKLKNVSLCLLESNPLVNCRMKTEWPYLIHEIKRVGRNVIFCIDCPRGREYRLPEQYAKAVSDHDIHTVNSYKILYAVIKRERDDASGISDLVIEKFTLSDVAGDTALTPGVRYSPKGDMGRRGLQSILHNS